MERAILFVVPQSSFRDEELFVPLEVLTGAGYAATLASHEVGTCFGMRGGTATATVALADVHPEDFDGVVFVGGNGARSEFADRDAWRIAQQMDHTRKIVAAICLAPVILARAGVLRGRRATVFPTEVATLRAEGAEYEGPGVVTDGHVVTGDGPGVADEFAQRVLRALSPRRSRTTSRMRAVRT